VIPLVPATKVCLASPTHGASNLLLGLVKSEGCTDDNGCMLFPAGARVPLKAIIKNTGNVRLRQLSLKSPWAGQQAQPSCELFSTQSFNTSQPWIAGMDVGVGQQVVCQGDYQTTLDDLKATQRTFGGAVELQLELQAQATVGQAGQAFLGATKAAILLAAVPQMTLRVDPLACKLPSAVPGERHGTCASQTCTQSCIALVLQEQATRRLV